MSSLPLHHFTHGLSVFCLYHSRWAVLPLCTLRRQPREQAWQGVVGCDSDHHLAYSQCGGGLAHPRDRTCCQPDPGRAQLQGGAPANQAALSLLDQMYLSGSGPRCPAALWPALRDAHHRPAAQPCQKELMLMRRDSYVAATHIGFRMTELGAQEDAGDP